MKNLAILKIIGGVLSESKPKGGAHWANRAFSDQTSERRSEA